MRGKLVVWAVTVCGLLGMVTAMATPLAFAATTTPTTPGEGLSISPPLLEVNADPGQTVVLHLKLQNVTKAAVDVTGEADDFGAKGQDGTPQILLNEQAQTRYSLKYWIPSVPSLSLSADQEKDVDINVNVPANAEPGGHYGVIRFTGTAPSISQTGVAFTGSIGALVLMNVAGQQVKHLSLTSFYTSRNGQHHGFFEYGPVGFSELIKNDGTIHFIPTGNISIYNFLGHKMSSVKFNSDGGAILPASSRLFNQSYNKHFLFGRYRATANINYNNQTITKSITFWAIPYRLVLIVLGVLIVIIAMMRTVLKSYVRRAVKRASGSGKKS